MTTSEFKVAWFTSPETTPRDTAPCEALARFVGKNYNYGALFLDIGSGSGTNASYLRSRGYRCIGIDSAKDAKADYHVTAQAFFRTCPAESYDCIIDINTLCHVADPPYEEIYKALKPGGKFFSIHPADGTEVDMTGKGYTRIADVVTMRQLLERAFTRYTIHICTNWNGNIKINSWQIEADK